MGPHRGARGCARLFRARRFVRGRPAGRCLPAGRGRSRHAGDRRHHRAASRRHTRRRCSSRWTAQRTSSRWSQAQPPSFSGCTVSPPGSAAAWPWRPRCAQAHCPRVGSKRSCTETPIWCGIAPLPVRGAAHRAPTGVDFWLLTHRTHRRPMAGHQGRLQPADGGRRGSYGLSSADLSSRTPQRVDIDKNEGPESEERQCRQCWRNGA